MRELVCVVTCQLGTTYEVVFLIKRDYFSIRTCTYISTFLYTHMNGTFSYCDFYKLHTYMCTHSYIYTCTVTVYSCDCDYVLSLLYDACTCMCMCTSIFDFVLLGNHQHMVIFILLDHHWLECAIL